MSDYKQTRDAAGKVTTQYGQMLENLNDDLVKRMNDARDFPANTCGSSRHAAMIAEALCKREEYPMLTEEPEHCGGSIAATVAALWECRADLRKMALDYLAADGQAAEAYQAQLAAEAKLAKMLEIVRRHDTGDMRREDMEARRILEKLEDVMKGDTDA